MTDNAFESIFVNGKQIPAEGKDLNHNDRIKIGNSILLFKHPAQRE